MHKDHLGKKQIGTGGHIHSRQIKTTNLDTEIIQSPGHNTCLGEGGHEVRAKWTFVRSSRVSCSLSVGGDSLGH